MITEGDFKNIKKIAHPRISHELLEIICLEKEATEDQKKEIAQISTELGNKFYREVLFLLTYSEIDSPEVAEKICRSISKHKMNMEKKLGRSVLLEIATLDYIHSRNQADLPTMVNKENIINQIARQAIMDSKTNAFSGEQLKVDIKKEMDRTFRYGLTFSVIMIDLDNFKAINDTHGHQNGDLTLHFFASLVIENLRKLDCLYRFGGDEFLILLPQTNIEGAGEIARKLHLQLNSTPCEAIGQPISTSMGVSTYGNVHSNSYTKLIESVDQALYKAKAEGKNLISLFRGGKCEILKQDKGTLPKSINKENEKYHCHPIVPGYALGEIYLYKDVFSSRISQYEIKAEEVENELERIRIAIKSVVDDLSDMQSTVEEEINKEHGAIFLAHKLILQDRFIFNDIESELNEKLLNGEIIVRDIFRKLETRFLLFEDKQRNDKAKDIRDIGGRVIRKLQGKDNNLLSSLPENTILLSQRLLPSDTIFLDKKHVRAIITVEGSRGSHSAILARALNIPYVTIRQEIGHLPNHAQVIVDGNGSSIITNPDDQLIKKYIKLIEEQKIAALPRIVSSKPLEVQGRKISLLANVSSREEAMEALSAGAEGVGLFRVENIYMSSLTMPDEDFLMSRFTEILKPLKGKEITVRLVDIGSDKVPSYLNLGNEINPALGLRGVRLLLKHRRLLQTQLSACIRLNKEIPVKIMLPMVTMPSEIRQVRNIMNKMDGGEKMQIGTMIETPAAIFQIDEILEASDFISIGTNDLIQYTMASDRENKDVAEYFDSGFQALNRSLEDIFKKSREASMDCVVCGEAAGDRDYIPSLLKLGLTKFSVLPNLIPRIRQEIIDYTEAEN